jgi:hypothetical protein
MIKTIENLVLGVLGLMAVVGLLCVIGAVVTGNVHSF